MDSGLWERVHCSRMSAFGDQFPSILLSDISALDAPPLCKASTSMWLLRACEAALIILQFYNTRRHPERKRLPLRTKHEDVARRRLSHETTSRTKKRIGSTVGITSGNSLFRSAFYTRPPRKQAWPIPLATSTGRKDSSASRSK